MKKTRKNGFYWVKDNGQWRVGEWLPDMERFRLTNGGHYSIGVLDEIDETPITRSQFKVEPGLSLEQAETEIAKKYGKESLYRYLSQAPEDTSIVLFMREACELHTASLTSEIKGLREALESIDSALAPKANGRNDIWDNVEEARNIISKTIK